MDVLWDKVRMVSICNSGGGGGGEGGIGGGEQVGTMVVVVGGVLDCCYGPGWWFLVGGGVGEIGRSGGWDICVRWGAICLEGMFGIDMGHHIACDLVACEDVDAM
jgi:hypothetical protein